MADPSPPSMAPAKKDIEFWNMLEKMSIEKQREDRIKECLIPINRTIAEETKEDAAEEKWKRERISNILALEVLCTRHMAMKLA
jgi:hypothetical protein